MTSSQFRLSRTGNLIEARVFELKTRAAADEYAESLARETSSFGAKARPVLCADHRPVVIYPQEVTDRLTQLFSEMNTRLARAAILVAASNATLLLQLGRIVREAGFENRRVFLESGAALTFLAPDLGPDEQARARQFLAEFRPS
ncbi:MAG: hypothetical protein U0263_10340 [Polyangiaceae bacterium]